MGWRSSPSSLQILSISSLILLSRPFNHSAKNNPRLSPRVTFVNSLKSVANGAGYFAAASAACAAASRAIGTRKGLQLT
jgi:hypothetical protein